MRKLVLGVAAAAVVAASGVAGTAEAGRGPGGATKPVAGSPGFKPGWSGHGGWRGYGVRHGFRHDYHPGWARHRHWGVGIGLGVAWPFFGWYDFEPYWHPDGYVFERRDPPPYVEPGRPSISYRFYCPSTAAYYPDVRECAQPWLKVVPQDQGPPGPPGTLAPEQSPAKPAPSGSPPGSQLPADRLADGAPAAQ